MASLAPNAVDVSNIQFKLHYSKKLYDTTPNNPFCNGNLLATASTYGIVIVGGQSAEIKVIQLATISNGNSTEEPLVRTIPLIQPPYAIALSCDHSMLAVTYAMQDQSIMDIFYVPSFVAANVTLVQTNIQLTGQAKELLWNPVVDGTLAVCLENGALQMYNVINQLTVTRIDKSEQVRCASWSPKGKQIVVGFPQGKLAQYKPDLTLAKTIQCPPNICTSPFDIIAVQWLSTYQFAAIFLKREQGSGPELHIVNAPKSGTPSYINYEDICYSQPGPRNAQVILQHILKWNLILVASANSIEVGVLGTMDTGDTPTWVQYNMLDEARAELPLNDQKQETYPIGLTIETGCTHQLKINETVLPVMPMMHMLSTNGTLVSFDIINQTPNCPSLCSPPINLPDTSGLDQFVASTSSNITTQPAATSTPAPVQKNQKSSIFGNIAAKQTSLFNTPPEQKPPASSSGSLFGASAPAFGTSLTTNAPASFSGFGKPSESIAFAPPTSSPFTGFAKASETSYSSAFSSNMPSFGIIPSASTAATTTLPAPAFSSTTASTFSMPTTSGSAGTIFGAASQKPKPATATPQQVSQSKPLITVPPNYVPAQQDLSQNSNQKADNKPSIDANESEEIIKKMITEEIDAFEGLMRKQILRTKKIDIKIGTKDEMTVVQKQLNELQSITDEATESTDALSAEIQSLRLSLNEAFSMTAEAQSKQNLINNMDYTQLKENSTMNQTSRRQLNKLQNMLAVIENNYKIAIRQIDAAWSSHLSFVKQNSKTAMHVPNLETIYQTLSKQREILNKQKIKISQIKTKLGFREHPKIQQKKVDVSINSLTDSIFSMSLCEQVKLETERLSQDKLHTLRTVLRDKKTITQIKPKRPERKGLNSEVIMEKKLAAAQKIKPKPIASPVTTVSTPVAAIEKPSKPKDTPKITVPFNNQPIQTANGFGISKSITAFGNPSNSITISKVTPSITAGTAAAAPVKPTIEQPKSTFGFNKPLEGGISFGNKSTTDASILFGAQPVAMVPISLGLQKPAESISFGSTKPLSTAFPSTPSATSAFKLSPTTSLSSLSNAPSSATAFSIPALNGGGTTSTPFGVAAKPAFSIPSSTSISLVSTASTPFGAPPTTSAGTAIVNPLPLFGSNKVNEVKPKEVIESKKSVDKENIPFNSPFAFSSATPSQLTFDTSGSESSGKFNTPSSGKTTTSTTASPKPLTASDVLNPDSLKICSPTIATTAASANTGSGLFPPFPTQTSKTETTSSIFTVTTDSSPFSSSFGSVTTTTTNVSAITTSTASPSVPSGLFASFAPSTTASHSSGIFGASSTATTTASIFGSIAATTTSTTTAPVQSATGIFAAAAASSTTSSSSIFGSAATTVGSIFASSPTATSTSSATQSPAGIFAAAAASQPSSGIFGGASTTKPDQSLFSGFSISSFGDSGATKTNVFGGNNEEAKTASSIFGGAVAASNSTSSIFGNSTTPTSSTASVFGNASTTQQATSFGSPFGTNSFGQPAVAAATSPNAGGSLFAGTSSFGASNTTSSPFGGSALAPSAFGTSTFGQAPSSGGSLFGGNNSFQQQPTGAFSGTSPVAQSGFAPASNAFTSPTPAFGAQPSFGGVATFGSPKGVFGSFAQQATTTFPSKVTQQNSLFETLGSTETGMTFGNIAQNTQNPVVQPQQQPPAPSFGGGSSFSSWR